jgi:chromosome segregation ATPase
MKTKTTVVGGLIVVCAAGALVWQGIQLRQQRENVERLEAQIERFERNANQASSMSVIERELARLRDRLDDPVAREESANTPEDVEPAGAGEETPAPPEDRSSDEKKRESPIERGIRQALQRGVDSELAKARERLNLTEDQEEVIRDFVEEALAEGGDSLRRLLEGEAALEELPSREEWGLALEQKVLSVLSPDQQEKYFYYKRQDSMAQARSSASQDIARLQGRLNLRGDQQEQVFDVLYQQEMNKLDPDPAMLSERPLDELEAAEWDLEQSIAGLQSILDEEQIAEYRKAQEERLNFFRGIRNFLQGGREEE